MGRLQFIQPAQQGLQETGAGRIGVGHDNGEIYSGKNRVRFTREIDRAGTIEHDIPIPQIIEASDIEFRR